MIGTPPRCVLFGKKNAPVVADRKGEFDLMVIGEIAEAHNQSLDWWNRLPRNKQVELYALQLIKPPRRKP